MNKNFRGFEFIQAYIDNLLIITKSDWSDHLDKLVLKIQKLKYNGLKCTIKKSAFGKNEMEYLGFWVTRTGIRPINKKIEAMVNMRPPNNTREACAFIGLVNYYKDMWDRQSHILHSLTSLMSPKVKFKWTDMEQKMFDDIKRTVAHDTLLAYSDFNKRFDIHIDARDYQLLLVISPEGQPISLYSRKLTKT